MPSVAPTAVPLAPVADAAPDFALPSGPDATPVLRELGGWPVVLFFFPADWSPVCGDQLVGLGARSAEFARRGAAPIGVSVDGVWSHAAFAAVRGIPFPLPADFGPKGAVARAYGGYRAGDGFSDRALFVLDGGGVVRWREVVQPWENPGLEGVLAPLPPAPTAEAPR